MRPFPCRPVPLLHTFPRTGNRKPEFSRTPQPRAPCCHPWEPPCRMPSCADGAGVYVSVFAACTRATECPAPTGAFPPPAFEKCINPVFGRLASRAARISSGVRTSGKETLACSLARATWRLCRFSSRLSIFQTYTGLDEEGTSKVTEIASGGSIAQSERVPCSTGYNGPGARARHISRKISPVAGPRRERRSARHRAPSTLPGYCSIR